MCGPRTLGPSRVPLLAARRGKVSPRVPGRLYITHMARSRIIRPEFFKHVELFEAEQATGLPLRVAFAGLWVIADRRGVFPWSRSIKPDVLPYDACDIIAVLEQLLAHGFIVRYEAHGRMYGWIPSFTKHQHFHVHERQSSAPDPPTSTVPAPDKHRTSTVPAPDKHRTSTVPAPDKHRTSTVPAPDKHRTSTVVLLPTASTSASTSNSKSSRLLTQPAAGSDWLAPYLAAWETAYGDGTGAAVAGGGGPARRPGGARHGAEKVLTQLRYYVGAVEVRYANPQSFAAKFAAWQPKPGSVEHAEAMRRIGEAEVAKRDAMRDAALRSAKR